MFIVTAQLVKPVNRDELPAIPNVESLKNGSLLGVEPKGAGANLVGPSGFMTTPETSVAPAAGPAKTATPVTVNAPVTTGSTPPALASPAKPNP